MSRYIAYLLFQ